ncbi:MAG TPA: SDR family NAD(P)-dependent oxidoreductase [Thermoanaerobaculia bacterium]|nr:SDR family NAD(P)-dependent oxidoreductase [Thermoanaerobaculia bacterium]
MSSVEASLEGIAIIGMAGQFPGAADLDQYWRNLRDGVESISFYTEEELLEAGVEAVRMRLPNYVRAGGALAGIDLFDAPLFGFSPREASIMEPQMRKFLEESWHALEDAGYDPGQYAGSIGVYGGMSYGRYLVQNLLPNRELIASIGELQLRIYNDKDFLASMAAYKLNLKGPSVTVQSACSTSLVAACLACQSLLNYQCDMALAGGVSITVPAKFGYQAQEGVFSPDGHCRAFDAGAQGTVQGSGIGIVVLKRLADAVADGDNVHAVIKGFALNNDGAGKVGYTAPSVDGQAEVVAMAQAVADIDPGTVTYIEAHGTGTAIGDPIEIAALTEVFRRATDRTGFCAVGSVKPNIGHLDAAAGVASLIKAVLAMKHRQLPPTLHFRQPNPAIDFASTPFYVTGDLRDWRTDGLPLRAGVSAFAVGGVNAHLVLEEAPPAEPADAGRQHQLLLVSARSEAALDRATARLAEHLERHPEVCLADASFTLQVGRKALKHRRALVCRDAAEAAAALAKPAGKVLSGAAETRDRPVAFLFPGLGNQYVGMARGLYETEPVFREQVDLCCRLLRPHLGGADLRAVLYPAEPAGPDAGQPATGPDLRRMLRGEEDAGPLRQTWLAHPALFVVEYALARLWMHWGIVPAALAGYSIGEYAAACVAGVFELEDALTLVARRARIIQELPEGAMLAVSLPEQEVTPLLDAGLAIAAVNGTNVSVVSGPPPAVAALRERLQAGVVVCRPLAAAHAFHSPAMEPASEPFLRLLAHVRLQPPRIPLLSDVTGTWLTDAEATDPRYWASHLTLTVRFGDVIRELGVEPDRIFLEVGPGQALGSWVLQHPRPAGLPPPVTVPSLRHSYDPQSDAAVLLAGLGKLWLAGLPLDWHAFHAGERRRRVPLPVYPFDRERYWIEPGPGTVRTEAPAILGGKKPDPADWFYLPVWRQTAPPMPPSGAGRELWVVFLDDRGLGDRLAGRLSRSAADVVTVRRGERYERMSDSSFTIEPRDPGGYRALLRELRAAGRQPQRIVHLWSVTGPVPPAPEEEQDLGFYSLLFLAQALGAERWAEPVEIAAVADHLHEIARGEEIHPGKATLLGPCRGIPQEYPDLRCRSLDVTWRSGDEADLELTAELLLAELAGAAVDDTVAYRGATRWVRGFEPVRLPAAEPSRSLLREGGIYLITGGLGGIGLTLAEHLAATVRAKLVLAGRSPAPAQDARLRQLRELGAEVLAVSADVTDAGQLRRLREAIRERFGGEVNGIIHAAGVLPGGMIQLKDRAAAAAVLAPKVTGTRLLAEVFRDSGLDFLLLCSSLTAITGAFGLVDHAAANAFLDHFAHAGSASPAGPRVISVSWDSWLEVGQAARAARELSARERVGESGTPVRHPLLDERLAETAGREVYVSRFRAEERWVLDEHRILGRAVVPGTALLEMALAAFQQSTGARTAVIEDVRFLRPLVVDDGEEREVRTLLEPRDGAWAFRIAAGGEDCATGRLRHDANPGTRLDLDEVRRRCDRETRDSFETPADDSPVRFGPRWTGLLKRVSLGEHEALAELELGEEFAADLAELHLHPSLLDAATGFVQLMAGGPHLPLAYERITVRGPLPRRVFSLARLRDTSGTNGELTVCDLSILDETGEERVRIEGYTLRRQRQGEPPPRLAPPPVREGPAAESGVLKIYGEGLKPREGAEALGRILGSGIRAAQWVVSTQELSAVLARAAALSQGGARLELEKLRLAGVQHPRPAVGSEYAAPRNEMERKLTALWREMLRVERIGIHDNFFDLGGDSLLATQLISRIEEGHGVDLTLQSLFQAPSVAQLGVLLVGKQSEQIEADALAAVLAEVQALSPEDLLQTLQTERERVS